METVKIAVVGSPGVGKTAIVNHFITGSFSQGEYLPTIDEIHIVRRDFNGKLFELEINDTAGSDAHAKLREIAIGNAEAFVVVYSVTSMDSFLDCKKFLLSIREIKNTRQIPTILVGCKVDLEETQKREVTASSGEVLAKKFHIVFQEVSAMDGKLVEAVFSELVQQVEQKRTTKVKSEAFIHAKKGCCMLF